MDRSCRDVLGARRLTRWSSVPTRPDRAGGGLGRSVLMMNSVEPTRSAASTTCIMHSGWTRILMPGNCWRNWATCAGLNIWWTEQWPRQSRTRLALDRLGRVAAQRLAGIPDGHLVERDAHRPGGVAAEVLVGEEEDATAAGERPFEHGAGVRAGADDPAVAAAEGLEVGRRVDVGDRHQVVGVDDLARGRPRRPRPSRGRPCRPCCIRRTGRAG